MHRESRAFTRLAGLRRTRTSHNWDLCITLLCGSTVFSITDVRIAPPKVAGGKAEDTAILAAITSRLFLLFILALLVTTAHTWGTQGHQVIASVAQHTTTKQILVISP